jgi:nicotinate-nucleotide pyrophosphorylase (carboxylating)
MHHPPPRATWLPLVEAALAEDLGPGDATSLALIEPDQKGEARLEARAELVVCGLEVAREVFAQRGVELEPRAADGDVVAPYAVLALVRGSALGILEAERTALNFVQRLAGIATLTRRYVEAVRGTRADIVDTRKTTPGWRALEKYAVRAGGGTNHRMDLSTGVLIKDNHLAALDGDVAKAVKRARELSPKGVKIEVECDRLDQVERAVAAGADIVLLDNMPVEVMAECVRVVNSAAILEASGGVNLSTVRRIAETGVNWISIGGITHSAPSMNLALDFE